MRTAEATTWRAMLHQYRRDRVALARALLLMSNSEAAEFAGVSPRTAKRLWAEAQRQPPGYYAALTAPKVRAFCWKRALGWSRAEIARLLRVSTRTITRWERSWRAAEAALETFPPGPSPGLTLLGAIRAQERAAAD